MNKEELIKHMRDLIESGYAGSQKDFAKDLGVSPAYMSDVLNGRREPGTAILSAIGVVRVVTYEKVEQDPK